MPKITPFLWFDTQAEDAAKFYVSVFPNSKILQVTQGPTGSPMTVAFELDGTTFTALNAGPQFKFTEAISFVINCESQDEIDDYWTKLTADGGTPVECGWLKDKFGLSWQVVPTVLWKLMKDPERGNRVMQKVLSMKKLIIKDLESA